MPKEGGKLNESEVGKQAMIIGNGEGKKSQLEWVIKQNTKGNPVVASDSTNMEISDNLEGNPANMGVEAIVLPPLEPIAESNPGNMKDPSLPTFLQILMQ